jgi:hypothetical protein
MTSFALVHFAVERDTLRRATEALPKPVQEAFVNFNRRDYLAGADRSSVPLG